VVARFVYLGFAVFVRDGKANTKGVVEEKLGAV
jgi:hypothetical protein